MKYAIENSPPDYDIAHTGESLGISEQYSEELYVIKATFSVHKLI